MPSPRTPCLAVFCAGLAVRLFYLFESADNPTFLTPVVDSETYDRLARALATGAAPTHELFWQPILYPLFLAAVYAASGGSIVAAKVAQAVLGAATCALTCRLGSRAFEPRVGAVAGWIAAGYGPLVFHDCELLATGWACFWAVLLALLTLAALTDGRARTWLALGICGGLALLTRADFLPFVALLPFGLFAIRRRVREALCLAGGLALVLLPAAAASARYAARVSFLPASGGINLHIGNNADAERTMRLRPGWEWSELTRLPERAGIERRADTPAFFRGLVVDYVREHPAAFARGLLDKAIQLASPRELPRNLDTYAFREWSSVLRVLVWKLGPFGFPFGVLLPLAVWGAWSSRRVLSGAVLASFVSLYGGAIVAVFVSGRYRAPLVPALAVLAAAALVDLARSWRSGQRRRVVGVILGALLGASLAALPGPFPQERVDHEQELAYLLGAAARRHGDLDRATELLSTAIALDPGDSDAHNQLGNVWAERGRSALALEHYRLAVEAAPDNALARENYGRVLLATGRPADAAQALGRALEQHPHDAQLRELYGRALREGGLVPPPPP